MAKKDSTIIYNKHVDICSEYLSAEQFGRLMFALMKDEEPDFGDDQMLSMAFAFISLQKNLDDKKYEERCRKNRENGKKGGRPKKEDKKPLKPNGFFENPNDNENDNDNEKENDNDNEAEAADHSANSDFSLFGEHNNVELTEDQLQELTDKYERSGALIDEVSDWIHNAKNHVPDHYGLCIRWAKNAGWPKRRQIEPVRPITVTDPLSDDEQREKVVEMKARLNKAFSMG